MDALELPQRTAGPLDALELALARPALHTPLVLCKLLAASKRLSALVHKHAAGTLQLQHSSRYAGDTASGAPSVQPAWLAKNAVLARELRLYTSVSTSLPDTGVRFSALMAALEAAAAHGSLRLSALCARALHVNTLASLPPTLTRLDLSLNLFTGGGMFALKSISVDKAPALVTALRSGALQQLRSLSLPCSACGNDASPLPAALAGMTALSSLDVSTSLPRHLALLPSGLADLKLRRTYTWTAAPLVNLGRLTAVTSLELPGALRGGEVLPPAVEVLTLAWQGGVVQPLLALPASVKRLRLTDVQLPASSLALLAQLQPAVELALWFADSKEKSRLAAAAAAFAPLAPALRELDVQHQGLGVTAVGALRACTALTRLSLRMCALDVTVTATQVMTTLAALTALQELALRLEMSAVHRAVLWRPRGGAEVAAVLGGAGCALPALRSCSLSGTALVEALAPELMAPALTALTCIASLKDEAAAAVCAAAGHGLRRLLLAEAAEEEPRTKKNRKQSKWEQQQAMQQAALHYHNGTLTAVAISMPQLTSLALSGMQHITDAGVRQLRQLTDLRELVLTNCPLVSAAARRAALGVVL